jgi:general secretion pathway protein D
MSRSLASRRAAPLRCFFLGGIMLRQGAYFGSISALALLAACARQEPIPEPQTLRQRPPVEASPIATKAEADTPVAEAAEPDAPRTTYWGGQGAMPAPAPRDGSGGLAYDPRRGVELNFVDADIRKVVDAILGEMLKANYSVDEAVKGTLTLRTGKPIARGSLIPALEAALSTVDAAIVSQGNLLRVVPSAKARDLSLGRRPLSPRDKAVPGFAVEILPVRYSSVKELEKLLSAIARKEAIVQVDETRNQIVIAGSSQERAAIRATIARFDVDWMRGSSFAMYKLESVEPEQLTSELQAILKPPIDLLARVRLVPLPRLKAVLGISARRSDLEALELWIKRLDSGAQGGDGRTLYIYPVQNGRARDLAQSLQLVLSGGSTSSSAGNSGTIAQSNISNSNAAAKSTVEGDSSATGGSTSNNNSTNTQSNVSSNSGSSLTVPTGDAARIVPDEPNNALLIFATRAEYDLLKKALKKLDAYPRQVLIEAILAEVTLTDDLQYGVAWQFNGSEVTITNSAAANGAIASSFPGFSVLYAGNSDVKAVLNALQSKTNVKVLSSPKLMVLNNQTATLQVGDQVPIITQQAQGVTSPGAPIVNTVELKDTGVILKVTPRVNDSGMVTLDVAQEVSDVAATTTSGINSPTIQQRKLSSTVATQSGNTIALGGLIRDNVAVSKSGIPYLSRIPVIGQAFRTTGNNNRRTELIILLTPTVIKSTADMRETVNDLIDRMDLIEPLVRRATKDQLRTTIEAEPDPKP